MHDNELKKLLLETHPVRPGQEERAWTILRERLTPPSRWAWIYYPTWKGAVVGMAVLCTVVMVGDIVAMRSYPVSYASADSQSPGIYATAFYSQSAHAQVVWLNGMEPASDQPTYLDPTSVIGNTPASKSSDSNSEPNPL